MDYLDELNKRKRRMTAESFDMAERFGISGGGHNGKQDAFRHTYISAKTTRDEGTLYARTMGTANEWKNEVEGRLERWEEDKVGVITKRGNPPGEWEMDEFNNRVGREIGRKAEKEGWNDERIAQEVKKALDEGKLVDKPQETEQPAISSSVSGRLKKDDLVAASPSILDYYREDNTQKPKSEAKEFFEWLWGN